MAELKDICISLETAQELVEAGIIIESTFSWFYNKSAKIQLPRLGFTNDRLAFNIIQATFAMASLSEALSRTKQRTRLNCKQKNIERRLRNNAKQV